MSPSQPQGAPLSGPRTLPPQVRSALPAGDGPRPFSVYLHVPYCRVRCGYCDFNTYTNLSMGAGASAADYVGTVAVELEAARAAMEEAGLPARPARTVFLGGGTPTVLPAGDLAALLGLVRDCFGLVPGAEVTTEANPDSVDQAYLETLAGAGFTRVSFGMQSAVPHVLAVLERTHQPHRVPLVVDWARRCGLETSLDLIYGAPGESLEDWQRSLEAALEIQPDHVSAYALVIEEGTRMWAQVRRGELVEPSDDDEATKYEMADAALTAAGYQWYEISNWARPGRACQHNQAYWRDWDWWGAGPGAHSHLGDVRLWNTRHPVAWAGQLADGRLPVAGHEILDAQARRLEQVMLAVRLREGLDLRALEPQHPERLVPVVSTLVGDGLLDKAAAAKGSAVLTLRGRLLADTVTRALVQGGT
ncbi:coproporphyrinogen III oxidase [Actinomyces sp. 2119]|uniref:Heme chaperone HemW n=1 Tax=Actinomyces lilanjuaniae TaxID=2321394 RepID=A0ABM6Z461_9ACTO|nr:MULTISPECIES: radical SAM family heme chaperone HemW [Actinomyces]AYD89956.1 coproporphyrinogen III oxidase [Actinomyces lilanjuaniae]RJF42437.1 coproporphyrinogen III oxidase [Actinomyces sp. 2119]